MKKVIIRSVLLLVLTVFLFYYILKDNFNESIRLLISSNFFYVFLAILMFSISFLIDNYIFKTLINRHKKDYSLKSSLELSIMTRFFNGITPFSLGGQPLQVYELSKDDVKITDGILVITEMFIIHEITITILTIAAIILKFVFNFTPSNFLWTLTIIGLIFNLSGLLITMFVSLKINSAKKIGRGIIKFLNRIHIVKDKEKSIDNFSNKCNEYAKGFKDLIKNKKLIIKCVSLNIINLTVFFSIAFFAILAIDNTIHINVIYSIVLSILVYISATFVPIPGGSVGAEYAYVNYFALVIPDNIVVTSLILWRFISYYLPMIIGGIVFNIIDNKRSIMCKDNAKKL